MLAVLFGALAGVGFGALMVAVRHGLGRGVDPFAGAVAMAGVAAMTAVLASIPSLVLEETGWSDLWPFLIVGLIAPGASQLILIMAVRDAGPSREIGRAHV